MSNIEHLKSFIGLGEKDINPEKKCIYLEREIIDPEIGFSADQLFIDFRTALRQIQLKKRPPRGSRKLAN